MEHIDKVMPYLYVAIAYNILEEVRIVRYCRYDKDANTEGCAGCEAGCLEKKPAAYINRDFENAVKEMELNMGVEETKREKVKSLCVANPNQRHLSMESIIDTVCQIKEEYESIRWYTDSEEGYIYLVDALNNDGYAAYSFKIDIELLANDCDEILEDLKKRMGVPKMF